MGLDLHFYFLLILSFVHHFRYDTPFCMLNILNGMLQYLFGKLYPIKLWLTQFRVGSRVTTPACSPLQCGNPS